MVDFAFVRYVILSQVKNEVNMPLTGQMGVDEKEGSSVQVHADADTTLVANTPTNKPSGDSRFGRA